MAAEYPIVAVAQEVERVIKSPAPAVHMLKYSLAKVQIAPRTHNQLHLSPWSGQHIAWQLAAISVCACA